MVDVKSSTYEMQRVPDKWKSLYREGSPIPTKKNGEGRYDYDQLFSMRGDDAEKHWRPLDPSHSNKINTVSARRALSQYLKALVETGKIASEDPAESASLITQVTRGKGQGDELWEQLKGRHLGKYGGKEYTLEEAYRQVVPPKPTTDETHVGVYITPEVLKSLYKVLPPAYFTIGEDGKLYISSGAPLLNLAGKAFSNQRLRSAGSESLIASVTDDAIMNALRAVSRDPEYIKSHSGALQAAKLAHYQADYQAARGKKQRF